MTQTRIDKSANQELSYLLQNIDSNFDELFDVIQILDADFRFIAQVAPQQLLNASPKGALNIANGLYWFESMFDLINMSATSGTFGFALGGSATIESQKWVSVASMGATDATEVAPNTTYNAAANTALTANSTAQTGWAWIKGVFRVSAAGTIIPQVSFSTITGGPLPSVKKNSFFRVMKRSQTYTQSVISPPQPLPTPTSPLWS